MIAEVFPKASRALAAGILQSAAGTGFFAAILLDYLVGGNWRYAFFGGAIPAFLALVVRLGLHEPEVWVEAKKKAAAGAAVATAPLRTGSLVAVFSDAGAAAAIAARDRTRDHRHLRLLGHELLGELAVHRTAARAGRGAGRDRAGRAPRPDRPQPRAT